MASAFFAASLAAFVVTAVLLAQGSDLSLTTIWVALGLMAVGMGFKIRRGQLSRTK